MEIRIRGNLEQLQTIMPILDKMIRAGFIMWSYPGFIAPFQYGDDKRETALIKLTKNGNLIVFDMQSPTSSGPAPAVQDEGEAGSCPYCNVPLKVEAVNSGGYWAICDCGYRIDPYEPAELKKW